VLREGGAWALIDHRIDAAGGARTSTGAPPIFATGPSLKVGRHKESGVGRNLNVKTVANGLLAGLLAVGFCAIPVSAASAAGTSSASASIVKSAGTYVNNIRDYFFCDTSKCKKSRSEERTVAATDMQALVGEATLASSSSVPSSQKAVVARFIDDVRQLAKAYKAYPKESSVEDIARNTGLIYYQSANVATDAYLLSVDVNGGSAAFVPWSVGSVAVLYAMQLDTEALASKTSTAADDLYASQNLEAEANSLLSDADGPNTEFNSLLVTFATIQNEVSADEIQILEKKKTSLTSAKVSSLILELSTKFKQIVDLQKKLSK
jgi:hypothetical protein